MTTIAEGPALVNALNARGETPLHRAALNGHTEVARVLLAREADVNLQDNHGYTPLHCAAERGHTEVARVLLKHRASVDAQGTRGEAPLHVAACCCNTEVAIVLLQNRADVNARDDRGRTALRAAERSSCPEGEVRLRTRFVRLLNDWPNYLQVLGRRFRSFCMAQHPRVGANSPARVLPRHLFQYIRDLVYQQPESVSAEEINQIAEQERRERR